MNNNKNIQNEVRVGYTSESGVDMTMMVCNGWKVAREELARLTAKNNGRSYWAV